MELVLFVYLSAVTVALNPLKPNSSNYYTLPYRPNLPFFKFLTFCHSERQSAQMSEIKNGRLGLYGAGHSKCYRIMTPGFEGLNRVFARVKQLAWDIKPLHYYSHSVCVCLVWAPGL